MCTVHVHPVDSQLLLYCHEGTWHELDRTWTIRSDGSQMRLIHKRTMDMEINGHEWWSWDGKTVWFDLQTPRSQVFWIAGVKMETGQAVRYHIERDWWGVHFNSSRDDALFAAMAAIRLKSRTRPTACGSICSVCNRTAR